MSLRVLCLGAYANGNVGDMYQADALAKAVRAVRPDAEIVSVSPSKRRSSYPAKHHTAGPADGAFDPNFINSFDVLLVGGGGLLSAPHAPLHQEAWVDALKLPVVAVALGAAGDVPKQSAAFVRKCKFFSVRDEYSHGFITELRSDAEIVMDPILLDQCPRQSSEAPRTGILWVPAKIVDGTRKQYADLAERLFRRSSDLIVSINPETDRRSGFDEVFGDAVLYLDSAEEFQRLAATRRFTVSERYHGCILALRSGSPCVGLTLRSQTVTSKITEMYRRVGFAGCTSGLSDAISRTSLRNLADNLDLDAIDQVLAKEQRVLFNFLERALH